MYGMPAHTGRPAVATAAECCYACADTPGCNIWNFCPSFQGCGSGCTPAKFGPQATSSYVRGMPTWYHTRMSLHWGDLHPQQCV